MKNLQVCIALFFVVASADITASYRRADCNKVAMLMTPEQKQQARAERAAQAKPGEAKDDRHAKARHGKTRDLKRERRSSDDN